MKHKHKPFNFIHSHAVPMERKATRLTVNSYVKSDSIEVVFYKICKHLNCLKICMRNWMCNGFNLRQVAGGGCSCELKGTESWVTFPLVKETGASYWQYS